MTEAEWRTCASRDEMASLLRGRVGKRKLRLGACACCRLVTPESPHGPAAPAIVEVAERYADGLATELELAAAYALGGRAFARAFEDEDIELAWRLARDTNCCLPPGREDDLLWSHGLTGVDRTVCAVAREILGPLPFRPVVPGPSWLTSTVRTLAGGIDAGRAFDLLPILADALQDAGCDDADVLDHCRGGGPHVRGCWVVDLLLGRT